MRQLYDEPKLVYEVGFSREKGKATAKVLTAAEPGSWWLAAQVKPGGFYGRSNSGLGRFFSLAMDSQAFSGELV
jgi:hypothetical protein